MIGPVDQETVVRELYRLSRKHPEDRVLRWRVFICDAETSGGEKALRLQDRALVMMDTTIFKYDYMRLQITRANALYPNDLFRRYLSLRSLLDYFTEIGDVARQYQIYFYLGTIFDRLNQHEKAYQVLLEPYKILESHGRSAYQCYLVRRIARQVYAMGNHQEAYDMLREIVDDAMVQRDTTLHIDILRTLCEFTPTLEEKDDFSRRALQMAQKYPEDHLQYALCSKTRGKYFLSTGQLDSAYHHLQVAVQPSLIQIFDFPGRYDSYKSMATLFALQNQTDSAYYYMEKSNEMNDSLVSTLQNIVSEEIIRSIADNEKEVRRVEIRNKRERVILNLFWNLALIITIIIAFYNFYNWRKNRKETLRKIHENERLKKEMGQRKEKYATANIILADQKNALNTINQIVSNETSDGDKNVVRQVKNIIRHHITDETNWDTFSLELENDYPGLLNMISTTYPTLTPTDLKICVYALSNLNTHQISRLLNILPDSVKKSRQRVRRKLGINYLDITIAQHISDLYDQMKNKNEVDNFPQI
ncbi:MAG: hypothetical protein J5661_07920 [Bacteroidaceae bacterium]|nr:hypothetical protein [Bacteroidaceae bacterium]